MSFGFSVYFGLDNTKEENIRLLKDAHKLGFTRIFTSLHIPEANYDVLKVEVSEFFKLAKEYDMDIISAQKADNRINSVASVLQKDFYLLKYINNGKKFYFRRA